MGTNHKHPLYNEDYKSLSTFYDLQTHLQRRNVLNQVSCETFAA